MSSFWAFPFTQLGLTESYTFPTTSPPYPPPKNASLQQWVAGIFNNETVIPASTSSFDLNNCDVVKIQWRFGVMIEHAGTDCNAPEFSIFLVKQNDEVIQVATIGGGRMSTYDPTFGQEYLIEELNGVSFSGKFKTLIISQHTYTADINTSPSNYYYYGNIQLAARAITFPPRPSMSEYLIGSSAQ